VLPPDGVRGMILIFGFSFIVSKIVLITSFFLHPTLDGPRMQQTPPDTESAHKESVKPLRIILIKHRSVLPHDGHCVVRNMLEQF
jgi:hypothetical protein